MTTDPAMEALRGVAEAEEAARHARQHGTIAESDGADQALDEALEALAAAVVAQLAESVAAWLARVENT